MHRRVLSLAVCALLQVNAGYSQDKSDDLDKKEASAVVKNYLEVEWQKRLPFVLNPETVEPLMRDRYKGVRTGGLSATVLSVDRHPTDKKVLLVLAEFSQSGSGLASGTASGIYILQKIKQGFKVDWLASMGHNRVPLNVFFAEPASEPHKFRLFAKIDSHWSFEFTKSKGTHYSILLKENDAYVSCHGYIAKEDLHGQRLFDLLKDGKERPIIVELELKGPNGRALDPGNRVAAITRLVSESWHDPERK